MSKEQAIAFFEEISKNKQLAQEVKKVVEGNNSDEAKAKELISLAKKHNFIFTPEDAQNAQETLKKPLSPEEMLEVSGGKLNLKSSLMAMTLLAGLGVGGAALTNMEASAMKRSTPPDGSYSFGGKRGKIDPPNSTQGQTLPGFDELVSGLSNRAPQGQPATTGTQQQTTPQTVGETNSAQRQTPPSNGQGSKPSNSGQTMRMTPPLRASTTSNAERHAPKPPREKKVKPHRNHDAKAAKRFKAVKHCGPHHVELARSVSSTGALPSADWPDAPTANREAKKEICRFCGYTLSKRGKFDVKCSNAGCIYNWVFPPTGNKKNEGNQRGQLDCGHYARWALLPALILDSRYHTIHSTGSYGRGTARKWAIETPAEAWAVWQLIVGHRCSWGNVIEALREHDVDETTIGSVILLLEESYDNLVLGNESFIDLGSEVQQLVAGYNNGWLDILDAMDQRGYDASTVNTAIARLERAYNMLTDEQLNAVGIAPDTVARNPASTLDEILKELTPCLDGARQQQAEEARQQREEEKEAARQQAIGKLQRGEALSDDEKKALARLAARSGLVKCRCQKAPGGNGCGSNNIRFKQLQYGNFCFLCNECQKINHGPKGSTFTLKPDDLRDMLPAAAPGNMPRGMAPVEPNEPPMQMLRANHTFNMNQMNDNNNINNLNNNNIDAAHQRFETAMQQIEARRQAIEKLQRGEELSLEEARVIAPMLKCGNCGKTGAYPCKKAEYVFFQCKACRKGISNKPTNLLAMLQEAAPGNVPMGEEARQQAIEKLQRGEKLSLVEAKAIAPMIKCDNCGNTGANASKSGKYIRFQCKKCKKAISKKLANLLAMLQEAAPENVPIGMVPIEPNKPQMQLEIQPMQMDHGDGPTFAPNFTSSTMPQTSMQGMNQFNPQQQTMMMHNTLQKEDEDEYNFDMGGYGDFDEDDGLPPLTSNQKSKEVKERREDYENQEPYIPEPGMMGYRALQQPMQMMSQNGFGFYLGGQDVNQFYIAQTTQQTFAPNLFNANKEQNFNIQRIPVFQMPTNQNDTQQQNEQIDPLNMDQMHITDPVQPIDHLLDEDQLINDDQNDLVMQQNTPVDQDQQPINDQPGLTFGPTQVFQQLAAQQNVTQPPQNPNENGIIWRFNAENAEDDSLIPGSWKNWGNQ